MESCNSTNVQEYIKEVNGNKYRFMFIPMCSR